MKFHTILLSSAVMLLTLTLSQAEAAGVSVDHKEISFQVPEPWKAAKTEKKMTLPQPPGQPAQAPTPQNMLGTQGVVVASDPDKDGTSLEMAYYFMSEPYTDQQKATLAGMPASFAMENMEKSLKSMTEESVLQQKIVTTLRPDGVTVSALDLENPYTIPEGSMTRCEFLRDYTSEHAIMGVRAIFLGKTCQQARPLFDEVESSIQLH